MFLSYLTEKAVRFQVESHDVHFDLIRFETDQSGVEMS